MINVAIDGPAGAGKSTVAKAVAKKLNLIYLDTGAMYRATAYFALQQNIDVQDEEKVKPMLENMQMDIVFEDGAQQIYVNGVNTTPYLREHYMSKAASDISALPSVRYKMVDLQRQFASSRDVVLDGRDIGTFVLPNANCKFFMTATPVERANRRYKELVEKGQQVDFDALLNDIMQRDYNDSHRAVAPLKQADDALYLDTTDMTIDQVVAKVVEVVKSKTKMDDEQQNIGGESEQSAKKPQEDKKKDKKSARSKKYYELETSFATYRFLRAVLRPLQAILWPTKLVGGENAEKVEGNAIFACNHYSAVDTLYPCFALFKREAHILAKAELFENAFAGWFLHKMGAIPVRRGEADINSVKCVLRVLKEGKRLMIFPEGTRNKEGTQHMAEFKTGTARFAIKTKSPIVPMIYYAPPKLFRRNYLYVGEPFTLEEFYADRSQDAVEKATEKVRKMMDVARENVNAYVASKKNKGKGEKK